MIRGKVKNRLGRMARGATNKAQATVRETHGPSPNPATNLILADIAIRGGGRLLRHTVERTLLGVKYPPDKARDIIKGRNMMQTLLGTAAARMATRSVPGALIVGGGLLAKTLYDRSRNRAKAKAEGEAALEKQADAAREA
jgi:hypothetical protein